MARLIGIEDTELQTLIVEAYKRGYAEATAEAKADTGEWLNSRAEICEFLNPEKPVPLLQRIISLFTDEDDVVIDPTAGSGTSLLAAGNLNRRAYGFEIKKAQHRCDSLKNCIFASS